MPDNPIFFGQNQGFGRAIAPHLYWRIHGTLASNGPVDATNGLSCSELQLRGISGGPSLATGGTPLSSGDYPGYPSSNAFDGNTATFWSSNPGEPQWLGYQFASLVSIVEFTWRDRGDGYPSWQDPTAMTLDYSDDGTTWIALAPFTISYTVWGTGVTETFTVI